MELTYKNYQKNLLIYPDNTLTQHFINPYLGFLLVEPRGLMESKEPEVIPIIVYAWGKSTILHFEWGEAGIDEDELDKVDGELGVIYQWATGEAEDNPHHIGSLSGPTNFLYRKDNVIVTTTLWDQMLLVSQQERLTDMFNAFFQNASIPLIMLSHSAFLEYTEMNDEDDEVVSPHLIGIICDLKELPEEGQVLGGTYHLYWGAPEKPDEYLMSWDSYPTPDIIGMGPILGRLFQFSPLSK